MTIPCVIVGNGVVIHLPGLFEEAEKNVRKGKGLSVCLFVKPLRLWGHVSNSSSIHRSGGMGEEADHLRPGTHW